MYLGKHNITNINASESKPNWQYPGTDNSQLRQVLIHI